MNLYQPGFHRTAIMAAVGILVAFNLANPGVAGQSEELAASGPLDGMSFSGALGPHGQPKDVADRFVFANGTFVSKECELRCKYPARPYSVNEAGGKTTFLSKTKCTAPIAFMCHKQIRHVLCFFDGIYRINWMRSKS